MSRFQADVERKLAAGWPESGEQCVARLLLESYGGAEPDRVRLAMIKLSAGSLQELHAFAARASVDYRDLLLAAEYPEEGRATHLVRAELSDAERKELRALRARDRQQYEAWLKS